MCVDFMCIEHNGYIIMYEKKDRDTKMFEKRCWCISKAIASGRYVCMKTVEALADLWVNKQVLHIIYPDSIEKEIASFSTCLGSPQFP